MEYHTRFFLIFFYILNIFVLINLNYIVSFLYSIFSIILFTFIKKTIIIHIFISTLFTLIFNSNLQSILLITYLFFTITTIIIIILFNIEYLDSLFILFN